MRVLVTGATGFVGGRLVPALIDRGHDVVALVRDRDRYDPPEGVSVVEGDLLEPGSFEVPGDVEAAYYLVHSMEGGSDGDFADRDRRAAANFRAAADRAGVDRVIYLGGLGGEEGELSKHLRSRREVEAVLGEGDYDLTVLRAAIVIGAGSASFDLVRQIVTRLPVMVTPRWVRNEIQPIAIDDVIAYLVGVLETPETAGGTYGIGGPEVLTYQSVLRRTAEVMDRTLFIVPVPVLSPKLSAYWLDLVTDLPASITHPLVDGLRNPVVVTDDRIRDLVEVDLTPFDESVRRALGHGAARDRDAGLGSGTDAGREAEPGQETDPSQETETRADAGSGTEPGADAGPDPGRTDGGAPDGDRTDPGGPDGDRTDGERTDLGGPDGGPADG